MARRRGGFVRVSGAGPRRATRWLGSVDEFAQQGIGAGISVLDQSFTGVQIEELGPFTITRTIGSLWVASDQVIAQENGLVALGMSVISEQARAAGVASIPSPFANIANEQFFVYAAGLFSAEVSVGSPTTLIGGAWFTRTDFDSRAQRKVENGDAIAVVLENSSAGAGAAYWLMFRMLIKVH